MELLDSGEDKVKKICDAIRSQTLDPAKAEAKKIIAHAIEESEKIMKRAHEEAKHLLEETEKKVQQEKTVLKSALNLSCKQVIQALRQEIEENVFNKTISKLLKEKLNQEDVIAEFIQAVVKALEKEGITSDISAFISKHISKEKLSAALTQDVLCKLKGQAISLSNLQSGVELKVKESDMTIELSDESLKQLLARFVREEFRELIFQNDV